MDKIKVRVDAAKLLGKDKIGVAVGKVVNQYKVAKHFELTIADDSFTFTRKADSIAAEAATPNHTQQRALDLIHQIKP
jgi:hypothetical protein